MANLNGVECLVINLISVEYKSMITYLNIVTHWTHVMDGQFCVRIMRFDLRIVALAFSLFINCNRNKSQQIISKCVASTR